MTQTNLSFFKTIKRDVKVGDILSPYMTTDYKTLVLYKVIKISREGRYTQVHLENIKHYSGRMRNHKRVASHNTAKSYYLYSDPMIDTIKSVLGE